MLSVSLQSLAESSLCLLRHCPVHSTQHSIIRPPLQVFMQLPSSMHSYEWALPVMLDRIAAQT